MSEPEAAGRVVFVSSPQPLEDGRPNFAHGCAAMLESRGIALEVLDHVDALMRARVGANDVVVLAPQPADQRLTPHRLRALRAKGCEVFVEAAALAPDTVAALGLTPAEVPAHPHLVWQDPACRGALAPFQAFIGGERPAHPFVPAEIETRYVPPAPAHFAVKDTTANQPSTLARKLALKRAFSWRFALGCKSPAALCWEQDGAAVIGLAAAAARMQAGASRRALAAAAAAGPLPDDAASVPVRRLLTALSEDEVLDSRPCAELVVRALGDLPILRKAALDGPAALEATGTVERFAQVLVLVAQGRREAAEPLLEDLCAHRLDRAQGAFFDHRPDGETVWSSHPVVGLALICAARDLELEAPAAALRRAVADTCGDLALWRRGPARAAWQPVTVTGLEVLAEIGAGAAGQAAVPAIWRDGRLVVFGFPVLATIGHAWTLPATDEPLQDGTHHWAFLLEHVVSALMIGPHRTEPALVVRHDVDRLLSDAAFAELLALYHARDIRASWYWIHDRLLPSQMRRLRREAHEIGLHLVENCGRAGEWAALEAVVTGCVEGETFHGFGADFHFGALSALAAAASGMRYSELHPFQYGLPARAVGVLMADGTVRLLRGCHNLTFTYSTDAAPTSRKQAVSTTPAFAFALLAAGYTACILNHPDMNRERLLAFLDAAIERGARIRTAADAVSRTVTARSSAGS